VIVPAQSGTTIAWSIGFDPDDWRIGKYLQRPGYFR